MMAFLDFLIGKEELASRKSPVFAGMNDPDRKSARLRLDYLSQQTKHYSNLIAITPLYLEQEFARYLRNVARQTIFQSCLSAQGNVSGLDDSVFDGMVRWGGDTLIESPFLVAVLDAFHSDELIGSVAPSLLSERFTDALRRSRKAYVDKIQNEQQAKTRDAAILSNIERMRKEIDLKYAIAMKLARSGAARGEGMGEFASAVWGVERLQGEIAQAKQKLGVPIPNAWADTVRTG